MISAKCLSGLAPLTWVKTSPAAVLTSWNSTRAEAFGHHEIVHGDFRMLFSLADRLARVQAGDIARAVSTHLTRDARCLLVVEPDGTLDAEAPEQDPAS